jgi:CHASE2 domain-containing sensor protein
VVAIGIPASLSAAQTLRSWDVFNDLFPDKVELYQQLGDNIALSASGNFQIDPDVLTNGSLVGRLLAAAFPGAFSVNDAWWLPLVAIFVAAWYALVLSMSRNPLTCGLLAAASITTLSLVVGNSAVLARHFLPLFYFSLLLFSQRLPVSPMWLGFITVAGATRKAASRRLDA